MADHEAHNHETVAQEFACDMVQLLSGATSMPCLVAIVEPDGELSRPFVSLRGNTTDLAHIAMAVMDTAIGHGRPTSCIACMANYDAMVRGRAAMDQLVGQC